MNLITRVVCLVACWLTGTAVFAAPVPKIPVKPLPDGLAGDWLLETETACIKGTRLKTAHTVRAGETVVIWSFESDQVRVFHAPLNDKAEIEERRKKQVRSYRLAWEKGTPDVVWYEDNSKQTTEKPSLAWKIDPSDDKLRIVFDPATPQLAPTTFDLPPLTQQTKRTLLQFVRPPTQNK